MDSRADHVRLFRNAGDQPETDDFATTPLRPGYEVEFEDRVIRRQGGDYEENIPDFRYIDYSFRLRERESEYFDSSLRLLTIRRFFTFDLALAGWKVCLILVQPNQSVAPHAF